MRFARRLDLIKPSATLAISAKATAMKAAGLDVVSFGAGEPDFDTPPDAKRAAIAAIEGGFTKYTAVGGIDELKDAIIAKLERDNHLIYRRSQVAVSCGAKHTLYNLAQALLDEGDEVLIPSPYWVSYPDIVLLAGAKPVIIHTTEEEGFKLQPNRLADAITSRTRALILNSPSNPSGVAYSKGELAAIAQVLVERDILIISDDIYEKIIYDGLDFHNIAQVEERLKDRTVVVNGISKAYAMTGWRIGYLAATEEIVAATVKLQSQSTSNPTSIAQKAAIGALMGDQSVVAAMTAEFERRRDFIVEALNAIPGICCRRPQGAFYVFPRVDSLYGRSGKGAAIENSTQLAAYLLEEAKVAVVPGVEFGHDENIRLSYATSMKNIEEGITRIARALDRLT
ncbi:MAG: pyridoxal phosphate-dependent aminotransferase [Smithellaceae bacterium]|nr:pyridoxal phosphate-dependent aminotransferase [Smithellaceae bacterium]